MSLDNIVQELKDYNIAAIRALGASGITSLGKIARGEQDLKIRLSAIKMLGELDKRICIPELTPLLPQSNKKIKKTLIDALTILGKEGVEQSFISFLKIEPEKNDSIRETLELFSNESIRTAIDELNDISSDRSILLEFIIRLYFQKSLISEKTSYTVSTELSKEYNRKINLIVIDVLKQKDLNLVNNGVLTCIRFPRVAQKMVKEIIKLFSYESEKLNVKLILALQSAGTTDAIKQIIKMLECENNILVQTALISLSDLKAESTIKPLFKLLNHSSEDIQNQVVLALGEFGTPEVLNETLNHLHLTEINMRIAKILFLLAKTISKDLIMAKVMAQLANKSKEVRTNSLKILPMIISQKSDLNYVLEVIVKMLKDKSNEVVEEARKILFNIGAPAIDTLLKKVISPNKQEREIIIDTLEKFGPFNVDLCFDTLEFINAKTACLNACSIYVYARSDKLSRMGYERAIEEGKLKNKYINLNALLNLVFSTGTDDQKIRFAEISRYADKSIVNELATYYKNASLEVKPPIINVFADQKTENTLPIILSALKEKNHKVKLAAITALGSYSEKEATSALIEYIDFKNSEIVEATYNSLAKQGKEAIGRLIEELPNMNISKAQNTRNILKKDILQVLHYLKENNSVYFHKKFLETTLPIFEGAVIAKEELKEFYEKIEEYGSFPSGEGEYWIIASLLVSMNDEFIPNKLINNLKLKDQKLIEKSSELLLKQGESAAQLIINKLEGTGFITEYNKTAIETLLSSFVKNDVITPFFEGLEGVTKGYCINALSRAKQSEIIKSGKKLNAKQKKKIRSIISKDEAVRSIIGEESNYS
ncbi:MAG: HEAT repeat domain-containing protein [Candidatus Kariarchaeaceae archaeon]